MPLRLDHHQTISCRGCLVSTRVAWDRRALLCRWYCRIYRSCLGTLQDEVYVSEPPGFVDQRRPHHVRCLRKALYVLKQVWCAWYEELKHTLLVAGFWNSVAYTSLFFYTNGGHHVFILVYVDDIWKNTKLVMRLFKCLWHASPSKILEIYFVFSWHRGNTHIFCVTSHAKEIYSGHANIKTKLLKPNLSLLQWPHTLSSRSPTAIH